MKGLKFVRPKAAVELKDTDGNPITLDAIRQRVSDGIFLGGDYWGAYDQYLTAHRDRTYLLKLIDSDQIPERKNEDRLR